MEILRIAQPLSRERRSENITSISALITQASLESANRAVSNNINKISLGNLSKEFSDLRQFAFQADISREAASLLYINREGQFPFKRKISVNNPGSDSIALDFEVPEINSENPKYYQPKM